MSEFDNNALANIGCWASYNNLACQFVDMQDWLKSYVKRTNKKGVVIGLSGGFDSSFSAFLAASLACLGKDKVFGILMPCDSSADSESDAINLAKTLDINYVIVPLKSAVSEICSVLDSRMIDPCRLNPLNPTEEGNIKARMRMITLYSFASSMNYLVLNTTNMSEAMTGNGTKFGDGAGDIGLFLEYTKTELYRMAKVVSFDLIFPNIYNKVPTADLEPGQTDEKTMGITYEQLDSILCDIRENDSGKIILQETVDYVKKLVSRSSHKRDPMPCYKNPSQSCKTIENKFRLLEG